MLALGLACSSSTTNEASGGSDAGGGPSGGTSGGGTSSGGAGGSPDAATDGDAGLACPVGMVPISGGFCIDATEVTNAAYDAWLATTGGTPSLSAPCDWKTSLAPSIAGACANRNLNQAGPVSCVDWCDAFTYCQKQKKHLCGQVNGGAVAFSSHDDPDVDEWHRACTNDGKTKYPYGDQYVASACAVDPFGLPVNTKNKDACRGKLYSELFDMSGNVAEWANSCNEGPSDAEDRCLLRGGSTGIASPADDAFSCAGLSAPDGGEPGTLETRAYASPHLGFRCCWDPDVDP